MLPRFSLNMNSRSKCLALAGSVSAPTMMFEREENLEISDGECTSARKMEKIREEEKKVCQRRICSRRLDLHNAKLLSVDSALLAGLEKHTEQMNTGRRISRHPARQFPLHWHLQLPSQSNEHSEFDYCAEKNIRAKESARRRWKSTLESESRSSSSGLVWIGSFCMRTTSPRVRELWHRPSAVLQ